MWAGVTSGLAGIKLSGSPSKYGLRSDKITNPVTIATNPTMSLKEKYGWKGTLSICLDIPRGLLDPV